MNLLNTFNITDIGQFPVKKGTLDFLQAAYAEIAESIMHSLIGNNYDPLFVYVMSGCINSGTFPNYIISAGSVYYGGEIFYVNAASFTATGSNVAVFDFVVTQYTFDADPVTFTDHTIRNVHDIRKFSISQGASGSTLANYSQAVFLNFYIPAQVNITATGQAVKTGAYPNINIDVPANANQFLPIRRGSVNVGDVPAGGADFAVTFVTPVAVGYTPLWSVVSNGTPINDTGVFVSVHSLTNTGFIFTVAENGPVSQNIALKWIAFSDI